MPKAKDIEEKDAVAISEDSIEQIIDEQTHGNKDITLREILKMVSALPVGEPVWIENDDFVYTIIKRNNNDIYVDKRDKHSNKSSTAKKIKKTKVEATPITEP